MTKLHFIVMIATLLLASLPMGEAFAATEDGRIVIDMAKDSVDVTTGFQGSDIVIFGTVDDTIKTGAAKDVPAVVVVLRGPDTRMVVRKKDQAMGMWINSDKIVFKDIPHFYDYAVSKPEQEIGPEQILIEQGIGLNTLVFTPDDKDDKDDIHRFQEFQEALIRIGQKEGNLPLAAKKIKFVGENLFRADFTLPASIPTGPYQVEAFLFKDGKLIDTREKILDVEQAGASAVIHDYAIHHSLLYALIGFAMAISMGVASNLLSRKGR